ncbi:MAG: HAD family hydrolase [Kiritimatiellae bacterium]|nr:HAD family hydrolase [Kiritimatiellia bacterium]
MTILWDWNGTLLDDTSACVDALNEMLRRRGAKPISMDFYRREFAFPVRSFYEKIGVRLDDEDWDALAREYHDTYNSRPFALNAGAITALETAKAAGARQAVLSALRQDMLDEATRRFGVDRYMDFVYGTDNLDGGSKLARARSLLESLGSPDPATVTMIGDSLHDAEVARDLGVKSVLFSGGGHSAERLSRAAPTFGSLVECVAFAMESGAGADAGPKCLV